MTVTVAPEPPIAVSAGALSDRVGSNSRVGRTTLRHYHARLDSRLSHLRCVIGASSDGLQSTSTGLLAATLHQIFLDDADWTAMMFRSGIAMRPRVIGGLPVVSLSCLREQTPDVVAHLQSVLDHTDWVSMAQASPEAAAHLWTRHARMTPRSSARALCVVSSSHTTPARNVAAPPSPAETEPRFEVSALTCSDADEVAVADPAPDRMACPAMEPLAYGSRSAGDGDQSWLAWAWDISTPTARSVAAAQLYLFAAAGAPFSPLFRLMRDQLGISYGARTSVQQCTATSSRGWIEVSVPREHEGTASELLQRALDGVAQDLNAHFCSSAPAFRTAVLSTLDSPGGAADAVVVGNSLGDPSMIWRTAMTLDDPVGLAESVPPALTDASLASTGTYRVGTRPSEQLDSFR